MSTTADDRLRGAVLGALVADAYCLGSHWVYDRATFVARYPDGPQGFEVPADDHFHAGKRPGDLTNYGEGCRLLLRSLAGQGRFEAGAYGRELVAFYADPASKSYKDRPVRNLLAAVAAAGGPEGYSFDQGSDDDQNITTSRLAPLVVRHAGDVELMLHVDAATRVLQDNDRAVAYACAHAQLLGDLLAGATFAAALDRLLARLDRRTPLGEELASLIETAKAKVDEPVLAVTTHFGLACPLVKSFPAAIHNTLRHGSDYAAAVRAGADAAGDNASRVMLVGSWLGAQWGASAIPAAWLDQLLDRASIEADLDAIIAARTSAPAGKPH